ncbi:hypothetical protein HYC85_003096 [Camellia sinensis]|uniref:TPR1-like CTLH-containing domain-containing protein n=1 Tax=Camellia sinensis TaxID=4442 RepID=A0A7J7IBB8_CAMSI|nr:hypothetical protein HYC85_003096 [Camellia sinensis]
MDVWYERRRASGALVGRERAGILDLWWRKRVVLWLWIIGKEAMDLWKDRAKAVDVLVKDLKVFSTFNEDLFKEITQLLTLENFRVEVHGKTKVFLGTSKAFLDSLSLCISSHVFYHCGKRLIGPTMKLVLQRQGGSTI